MDEPLISLLQREVTILAKNYGQLNRTCWEISRLLLRHRLEYGMTSVNKGESGAESERSRGSPAVVESSSVPDEPSWVQEEVPF